MNQPVINFVYTRPFPAGWRDWGDVDASWSTFMDSTQVWLLQSYFVQPHLTLSDHARPDCVNLIQRNATGAASGIADLYCVSVRSDKGPTWWANYEIVQNQRQRRRRTIYITHWPQPGLVPRKADRSRIENVAFLGAREQNALHQYPVERDLKAMGLNYIAFDRERWNDTRI
jgi:hypothetical protein